MGKILGNNRILIKQDIFSRNCYFPQDIQYLSRNLLDIDNVTEIVKIQTSNKSKYLPSWKIKTFIILILTVGAFIIISFNKKHSTFQDV